MANSNENMNIFTSKIVNNQDILKSFLFQIRITPIDGSNSILSDVFQSEELMLRAKSITIPSKSFSELKTSYMGSELVYPGKAQISGTFSITFDEFQDMYISDCLDRWQNLIYNQNFSNESRLSTQYTGGAASNYLKDYCATVDVILFDSTLKTKLNWFYRYYYVWPKNLSTAELSHENDSKVTRQCEFQYSTFEMLSNV